MYIHACTKETHANLQALANPYTLTGLRCL